MDYGFAKERGVDDDAIFASTLPMPPSLIPRKWTNPKDIFHHLRLLSMTARKEALKNCSFLNKQSCRIAQSKVGQKPHDFSNNEKIWDQNLNLVPVRKDYILIGKWSDLVSHSELNLHQPRIPGRLQMMFWLLKIVTELQMTETHTT